MTFDTFVAFFWAAWAAVFGIVVILLVRKAVRRNVPPPPSPDRRCRSCATALTEHVTRCSRCDAEYHRACWRALNRCVACEPEPPATPCLRCGRAPGADRVHCPRCNGAYHARCWREEGECVACRPPPPKSIEILDVKEAPSVGQCQVCGSAMNADLVQCRKCKTPHHRACWTYLGKCSTYACSSRSMDPLGEGEVFVLDDARPRDSKNRVRVWMERIADSTSGMSFRRESSKRGRYQLRFERAGIPCTFNGRRTSDGWTVGFLADLKPEQRARMEATPAAGSFRRTFGADHHLVLEPTVEFDSFDQLRSFFQIGCAMIDAASRSQDSNPAGNDLDVHR